MLEKTLGLLATALNRFFTLLSFARSLMCYVTKLIIRAPIIRAPESQRETKSSDKLIPGGENEE